MSDAGGDRKGEQMMPAGTAVSLVAAMAENRVIGREGRLPWHIPADLKRFRELTMGHAVIVGSKTWQSIGHPLPGRRMIVLTRQQDFSAEGCIVAHDLDEALRLSGDDTEPFVGGGADVFRQALPLARRIFLTVVHGTYPGDALFPAIPPEFEETARLEVPGSPSCTFLTFERRR